MASAQTMAAQIVAKLHFATGDLHILTDPSIQPKFEDGGIAATALNSILANTLTSKELQSLSENDMLDTKSAMYRRAIARSIALQISIVLKVSLADAKARFCALSEATNSSRAYANRLW